MQSSSLYRCGSRSKRRHQYDEKEPATERHGARKPGWVGREKKAIKEGGRNGRGSRYLYDKKATRGYAIVACPIERTPNLARPTPIIKLQALLIVILNISFNKIVFYINICKT